MHARLVVAAGVLAIVAATAAHGALLRVGAGGDFATVQAAVDAAMASAGEDEIRIRSGSFAGRVLATSGGGAIVLSGGWDATWTTQGTGQTSIIGDGTSEAMVVLSEAGHPRTVSHLRVLGSGAIALVASSVGGDVLLSEIDLSGGAVDDTPAGRLGAADGGHLSLVDSLIRDNQSVGRSGALYVVASGGGTVTIRGNQFVGNHAAADGQGDAAALSLNIHDGGHLELTDNVFRDNVNESANPLAGAFDLVLGGFAENTPSFATLARNVVSGASGPTGPANIRLFQAASELTVRDSVFAGDRGVSVYATAGTAHLTNLTVDSGSEPSLNLAITPVDGAVTLTNSLLSAEPIEYLGGSLVSSNNLVGSDPGFVNPEAADYRIFATSSAVDAGTDTPPDGLGDTDAAGHPRLAGAHVDLGAYEVGPFTCVANDQSLCLGGRFAVDTAWQVPAASGGGRGVGHAVALTADTGYFWFFSPTNVELVTKTLNACSLNGHSWVFAGGLTNVATALVVTDSANGEINRYDNPQSTAFRPIQDTSAFATCP